VGTTYTYDPNGNLATKTEGSDSWVYSWNAENQLTRVTKNTVEQARFSYDPLGRRVEKVADGITTGYAYDGTNILREVRGPTTLKYVHASGIDEPLAVDDGTALSYFHADAPGSIVKVTDHAGGVTLTRQYDAWGNLEVGASTPGYAFTGREWDPQTGLYYYRARYYDPKAGRFISKDPIGFAGGINYYAYVGNRPTVLTDPSGTAPPKPPKPEQDSFCFDRYTECNKEAAGAAAGFLIPCLAWCSKLPLPGLGKGACVLGCMSTAALIYAKREWECQQDYEECLKRYPLDPPPTRKTSCSTPPPGFS
jgi:RHS repeat-associated protein